MVSFLFLASTWFLPCLLFVAVAAEGVTAEALTVVGSKFASTRQHATTLIQIPSETIPGDLLVIFIGGSGRPFKDMEPSGPIPGEGWTEIIRFGPKDINLKAFYKIYGGENDSNSRRSTYKITEGKSIFAAILAIRGADSTAPIVDAAADGIDTLPGNIGASRAPAVLAERGGIVLSSFAYDDPQKSGTLITPGFSTEVSFRAVSGDGLVVGASNTTLEDDGLVGPIDAIGTFAQGAGNEVALSISIRAAVPPLPESEKPEAKHSETTINADSPMPSMAPSQLFPSAMPTIVQLPSAAPTLLADVPSAAPTKRSQLLRTSTQNNEGDGDTTIGNGSSNYPAGEDTGSSIMPKCGDGTTIVFGKTFCYVKVEVDGTFTRNDAKKCDFFEVGDTATRLKNHCNGESDVGSVHCPACRTYMKSNMPSLQSSMGNVVHFLSRTIRSFRGLPNS